MAWGATGTENLNGLMCRAGDDDRPNASSSRAGHAALFDAFTGPRLIVSSRQDMAALLVALP